MEPDQSCLTGTLVKRGCYERLPGLMALITWLKYATEEREPASLWTVGIEWDCILIFCFQKCTRQSFPVRHFSGSAAEYLAISTTFVKLTMYIQMYMLCKFSNHLNFYFSFVSHCGYRDETGERNEKKKGYLEIFQHFSKAEKSCSKIEIFCMFICTCD